MRNDGERVTSGEASWLGGCGTAWLKGLLDFVAGWGVRVVLMRIHACTGCLVMRWVEEGSFPERRFFGGEGFVRKWLRESGRSLTGRRVMLRAKFEVNIGGSVV